MLSPSHPLDSSENRRSPGMLKPGPQAIPANYERNPDL